MKKIKKQRLVLLDAHAIIHRAYHGMPDFTTRAGVPTGAIYGFATMVLKIINEFKPDHIVACYDLPGKTFRHETFDAYKGTRSKTDEALKSQFPITRELCDVFSIPIYDKEGFEADDLLGTIAEQLKDQDVEIIIASGDMDTLQLVDGDRVRVYTLKKGIKDTVIYNEEAVLERFNFPPQGIIDYKAFRGDPSDNIPGIRGIGDKAATLLISAFGTLESVYEKLEKDEQILIDAGLTKRMVSLVKEGREDAEFSKILATIRLDVPVDFVLPEKVWSADVDIPRAQDLFEKYELRTLSSRLHQVLGIEEKVTQKPEIELSEAKMKDYSLKLHILDSDYTDVKKSDFMDFAGTQDLEQALVQIDEKLDQEPELKRLYSELELPLMPLVHSMKDSGIKVDVDILKSLSLQYHSELEALQAKIYELAGREFNIKSPKQLSEILFEVLDLPKKGIKKSKTGTYSTNIDSLEKLKDSHEIISFIMEFREIQKLVSTYIDVFPLLVGEDGRIHAEFLQHGTSTGRFSSRNPNMQNIPTRSEHGRAIRKAFVADDSKTFVSLDYSQVELRILAILSGDEKLVEIFKKGEDIHSSVAALIGGVPVSEVDKEMRRKAKIVNFGILYGMGVNSVHKEIGGERSESQKFYHGFFEQFPKAAAFLEATKQFARDHTYTKTLFGRRRQFKKINAKLPFIRAMAERMALNAPIQGTSADLIKIAMIALDKTVNSDYNAKLVLQIHDELVYELPKENREEFEQKAKEIMENIFDHWSQNMDIDIPLLVHTSHGDDWSELK